MNDRVGGEQLLRQAVAQTKGWYGIYPGIAKAYLLLGEEQRAIDLIKKAVSAEPKWREDVSAFYCLYDDPAIRVLYPESRFTVIDWNNAISMLTDLKKTTEAIHLARKVILKFSHSSYTWYLLAKAELQKGDLAAAKAADVQSLKFDPDNADAKRLLAKLLEDILIYSP